MKEIRKVGDFSTDERDLVRKTELSCLETAKKSIDTLLIINGLSNDLNQEWFDSINKYLNSAQTLITKAMHSFNELIERVNNSQVLLDNNYRSAIGYYIDGRFEEVITSHGNLTMDEIVTKLSTILRGKIGLPNSAEFALKVIPKESILGSRPSNNKERWRIKIDLSDIAQDAQTE